MLSVGDYRDTEFGVYGAVAAIAVIVAFLY